MAIGHANGMREAPITNRAQAESVLTSILMEISQTDAYHTGETDIVLTMVQDDVKRYLIDQLVPFWTKQPEPDKTAV